MIEERIKSVSRHVSSTQQIGTSSLAIQQFMTKKKIIQRLLISNSHKRPARSPLRSPPRMDAQNKRRNMSKWYIKFMPESQRENLSNIHDHSFIINKERVLCIDLKLKNSWEGSNARSLSTLPVVVARPKKKRHEIIEIIKLTDLKGLRDIIFIFLSLSLAVSAKSVSI